jgi:hypothetical protein
MPVNEPPRSPFTSLSAGFGLRPQTVAGLDARLEALDRYAEPSLFAANKNFTVSLADGRRHFRLVQWRRSRRKCMRAASKRRKQMDMRKHMGNVFLKVDQVKASGPSTIEP